jgi:methyl-accepting chemotaxis protein
MSTTTRVLATGGLAGLVGAVLTLVGTLVLGKLAGGAVGVLAAAGLGAAAAWLAARAVARRVVERVPGAAAQAGGLADLEEALGTLAGALRARAELADLERLAATLGTADAAEGDDASRGERRGARERIEALRRVAARIAQGAEALGEATERMSSGAIDQTETVSRTTTAVEALSDRIDRISQNAEEASGASERARQEARRGLEQIQGIIAGMDRLRAQVEGNARKARRLGDRSVEIGAIVELISGVSSRTDMLALNATIESVRAGEHGRGFAVVAEEIRKLAERTAMATREIGALVEAIQADAHESIRASAEEQAEMEQEVQGVREAGAALERISQVAEQSARLVEGISHSANDQVVATQDLVVAIQRIAEVSKLIVAEASHVRTDARALVGRCRGLLPAPAEPAPAPAPAEPKSRPEPHAAKRRPQAVESSR